MSYLFLSSPYYHPSSIVRHQRYVDAVDALAWLLKGKIWTYSSIVNCHPIAMRHDIPGDFEYWEEYNHLMILNSRGVMVLQSKGWEDSRGIADEILFAKRLGLPIHHMQKENSLYAISRDLSSPNPDSRDPGNSLRASEVD
jgi:hypothetical protein